MFKRVIETKFTRNLLDFVYMVVFDVETVQENAKVAIIK